MAGEKNNGGVEYSKETITQQSVISCLETSLREYEESHDSFKRLRLISGMRHARKIYPEVSKQYLDHLIETNIHLLSKGDISTSTLVESVSFAVEFNLLDSLKEYMEKIYGHLQDNGKKFEFRMALFGVVNKVQGAGYSDLANELRAKYLKTPEDILVEHARNHHSQQNPG